MWPLPHLYMMRCDVMVWTVEGMAPSQTIFMCPSLWRKQDIFAVSSSFFFFPTIKGFSYSILRPNALTLCRHEPWINTPRHPFHSVSYLGLLKESMGWKVKQPKDVYFGLLFLTISIDWDKTHTLLHKPHTKHRVSVWHEPFIQYYSTGIKGQYFFWGGLGREEGESSLSHISARDHEV